MPNLKENEMKKKINLQREKELLSFRIKNYLKSEIDVQIMSPAINEATDFFDDLLTQYAEIVKEINYERKQDRIAIMRDDTPEKIKKVMTGSITTEDAVDARHELLKRFISQNM